MTLLVKVNRGMVNFCSLGSPSSSRQRSFWISRTGKENLRSRCVNLGIRSLISWKKVPIE